MRVILLNLLLYLLLPTTAAAEIVQQTMRPGIPASAEYLAGDRAKPAILLLHGFLQTREFATVASLARGLNDAGYTVLSPTLSLGIPGRKQSLACEAIHKHGMDDDVAEIARWVTWLKSRGHGMIVMFGHSFGSLQGLAYLTGKPDAAVRSLIGISLIEVQIGGGDRAGLIGRLESSVADRRRELVTHPLSFCRKYLSTPDSLLSYVRWDQKHVLAALKQLPVPARLIMGDRDELAGQDWPRLLHHVQVPMTVIKGANHFMDGEHEFDLLEFAILHLEALRTASSR